MTHDDRIDVYARLDAWLDASTAEERAAAEDSLAGLAEGRWWLEVGPSFGAWLPAADPAFPGAVLRRLPRAKMLVLARFADLVLLAWEDPDCREALRRSPRQTLAAHDVWLPEDVEPKIVPPTAAALRGRPPGGRRHGWAGRNADGRNGDGHVLLDRGRDLDHPRRRPGPAPLVARWMESAWREHSRPRRVSPPQGASKVMPEGAAAIAKEAALAANTASRVTRSNHRSMDRLNRASSAHLNPQGKKEKETMQSTKLLLSAVLVTVLFGVAACTGEGAGDMSGSAVLPACEDLGSALNSVAPTQRLDWATLEDACGTSPEGSQDLEDFHSFLAQNCPSDGNCLPEAPAGVPEVALALLYKERSASDVRAGIFKTVFPQAKDVAKVYEIAAGAGSGSGGDTGGSGSGGSGSGEVPAGGDTSSGVAGAAGALLSGVYQQVAAAAGNVDLGDITEIAMAADPASGANLASAIGTEIRVARNEKAQALARGEEVSPAEAVEALKSIEAAVARRLDASAPAGAAGGGTYAALMTQLGQMSGSVSWSEIEKVINQIDPQGGSNFAKQLQSGIRSITEGSPLYPMAKSLLNNEQVPTQDATDVVKTGAANAKLNR